MPATTSSPHDAQRESSAADLSGGGGSGGSVSDGSGGSGGGPAEPPADASPPPGDLAGPEAVAPTDTTLPADLAGSTADSATPGRDVSAPQDVAPSAGLMAAWAFDQRPAAGTTTLDDGLGNAAALRGSTTWGDDRPANATSGPSLYFPGGSGYVAVTMTPGRQLASAGPKSIAFWCKSTDPDTPTRTLIAMYNQGKTTSVGLQIGIGQNKIEAWPYGLTFRNLSHTTPTPRSWHHVAYTFTPGVNTLYVDGVEVARSTTWAPKVGTLDVIRLGTTDETATPGNFYLGYMRELRIYDQALGPAEIRTLAGLP